jgi:hypothetical protein
MDEPQWIYLDEVFGELQAEIFRGLLEANGISVLLSQEGVGKAYGLSFTQLGKVEILVPEEHLRLAKQILSDYKAGKLIEILDDESNNSDSDQPSELD